jgi:hypothetical protein
MKATNRKPVSLSVAIASLGLESSGLLEGWEDHVRAERALKSELGIIAHVGVITVDGSTSVSVDVHSAPAGAAPVAKRQIADVVRRACHLKVEHVDVSY